MARYRFNRSRHDQVPYPGAERRLCRAAPFASGGVYVNFLTADEGDRVRSAYGPNYDRLARVKRKYDPDNLFRMNQNIKPV